MSDSMSSFLKVAATVCLMAALVMMMANIADLAVRFYKSYESVTMDTLESSVYATGVSFPLGIEMTAPEAYKYYMNNPNLSIGVKLNSTSNTVSTNFNGEPGALISTYAGYNAIFKTCNCVGSTHQYDLWILDD